MTYYYLTLPICLLGTQPSHCISDRCYSLFNECAYRTIPLKVEREHTFSVETSPVIPFTKWLIYYSCGGRLYEIQLQESVQCKAAPPFSFTVSFYLRQGTATVFIWHPSDTNAVRMTLTIHHMLKTFKLQPLTDNRRQSFIKEVTTIQRINTPVQTYHFNQKLRARGGGGRKSFEP